MALDPATVSTVLSLLPTILEQANKTIEKLKKGKKKDGEDAQPGAADARDPAARIAELEATAMQQAEAVKLLAEQHAITIEALRREAARLDRRLRLMTAVAMAGVALGLGGLVIALNLLFR